MVYKTLAIFLLIFVSFINLVGCSDDSKDAEISSLETERSFLNNEILKLERENKELIEKIADLSEKVGIGKKQYLEENEMSNAKVIVIASLLSLSIVILTIIHGHKKISKIKEIHEKERIELNEKNSVSQKIILDLEHKIKQLNCALDDSEKNEVSNLLKTLKEERESRKHKIGGLNDEQ